MVSNAADMLLTLDRGEEAIVAINEAQRRLPDSLWVWGFRWRILFYGRRIEEAAKMLAPETPKPRDVTPFAVNFMRFVHSLFEMPQSQRETVLRTILGPEQSPTLQYGLCQIAGWAGCVDLAYEMLLDAIATKRPIGPMGKGRGVNRAFLTAGYFTAPSVPLQRDVRFPQLCAHAGLVDYWRDSGRWPDCASEVPYDFRAECEKATGSGGRPSLS
jgi:adenylate cyclase